MKIKVFSASWCNPCKSLKASLASSSISTNIEFIDIEANQSLTKEMGIRTVPTTVLYNDSGVEVQRISGNNPVLILKATEAIVQD